MILHNPLYIEQGGEELSVSSVQNVWLDCQFLFKPWNIWFLPEWNVKNDEFLYICTLDSSNIIHLFIEVVNCLNCNHCACKSLQNFCNNLLMIVWNKALPATLINTVGASKSYAQHERDAVGHVLWNENGILLYIMYKKYWRMNMYYTCMYWHTLSALHAEMAKSFPSICTSSISFCYTQRVERHCYMYNTVEIERLWT